MERQSEEWCDIKGYEGYYQVSSLGRIRSLTRTVFYSDYKPPRVLYGGIIKSFQNRFTGYVTVRLNKEGRSRAFSVHTLVAKAFHDNPHNYPCVNHIDGDKKNNEASNLEWCSYVDNMRHAVVNGLYSFKDSFKYSHCKDATVIMSDGTEHRFKSLYDACSFIGCAYPETTARVKNGGGTYTFSRGKNKNIQIILSNGTR